MMSNNCPMPRSFIAIIQPSSDRTVALCGFLQESIGNNPIDLNLAPGIPTDISAMGTSQPIARTQGDDEATVKANLQSLAAQHGGTIVSWMDGPSQF